MSFVAVCFLRDGVKRNLAVDTTSGPEPASDSRQKQLGTYVLPPTTTAAHYSTPTNMYVCTCTAIIYIYI